MNDSDNLETKVLFCRIKKLSLSHFPPFSHFYESSINKYLIISLCYGKFV